MIAQHQHTYVTVVPVYKAIPSKIEACSLLQLRLLQVENVTLVCPEGLDIGIYLKLWSQLKVQYFAPEHFVSVKSYNDLVLSIPFYQSFAGQYRYLLIYQLDAFLLTNQITKFCELAYDYYGAPWLIGFPQYRFILNRFPIRLNMKRFYVGNGGLSLRNIANTIDLLERKKAHVSKTFLMEDAFFGYWGSIDPHFHACPVDIAARFALESHPEHWMKITGELPMGFHGFAVWGEDFYEPLLKDAYTQLTKAFPSLESL